MAPTRSHFAVQYSAVAPRSIGAPGFGLVVSDTSHPFISPANLATAAFETLVEFRVDPAASNLLSAIDRGLQPAPRSTRTIGFGDLASASLPGHICICLLKSCRVRWLTILAGVSYGRWAA
jgi:hypothetical protein